jgi:hypothetical protein
MFIMQGAPATDPSAGHDPLEYRFLPASAGNLFRIVVLPTQAERIAQFDAGLEGIPFPSEDPRDPDRGCTARRPSTTSRSFLVRCGCGSTTVPRWS